MTADTDTTAVYRDTRLRVGALVAGAGPPEVVGERPVPACPQWKVRDVVAHLAGVCDDILAGRLDGVATDPWTAAQVERRAGHPLDHIVAEWNELGARVEDTFGPGGAPAQLVFDEVTHEQDLRGALSAPGGDDSAVAVALGFVVPGFGAIVAGAGLGALRVRAGDGDWDLGEGEPAATLTGTPLDVLRSLSGRRSGPRFAALDWGTADPEPWLPLFTFGPFRPPSAPVE